MVDRSSSLGLKERVGAGSKKDHEKATSDQAGESLHLGIYRLLFMHPDSESETVIPASWFRLGVAPYLM